MEAIKVRSDMNLIPEMNGGMVAANGERRKAIKRPDHIKPLPNKEEEVQDSEAMVGETQKSQNVWKPNVFYSQGMEMFCFAGREINIRESLDSFGALIWPGAVALCQYLENNQERFDLRDKAVLELGAGTGLVSIVASLLGAWVTATDLPNILHNLTFNLHRNTRGRCRYTPQVAELTWGLELEENFPRSIYHYDYVLCADVVYHHSCLNELLLTMRYFCRPGTTLLWANKVRFPTDLQFTENFQNAFSTTLLAEIPQEDVKIYQATVLAPKSPKP
ncbi:S-adenosylmethionine-dependent methyltransferase domain-containing protein [Chanos chanos]|uniref:S-adenosylmethionine-dependent methyltransferase domain-containing protein n=1 Tax=Chanos chanos TaxID=29144 RepID=A0A6J2WI58_CHACN|nr:protein-lysine methyltransferase METTL21C-like [Chanos chanos]